MKPFVVDMHPIRAEDALKEKTKTYLREELQKRRNRMEAVMALKQARTLRAPHRLAAMAAAVCLLAVLGISSIFIPTSYVSVDINPSVELGINLWNRVALVRDYNEDGALLLASDSYWNLPLHTAVRKLVEEAVDQGYVLEDGTTVISITTVCNGDKASERLRIAGEEGAALALEIKAQSAIVYTDQVALSFRDEAQDAGFSPGKYKLIQILQAMDPELDVESLRGAKVTEILERANEILGFDDGAGISVGELQKIRNAVRQIEKATERNRNQEQRSEETRETQEPSENGNGNPHNDQGNGASNQENNRNENEPSDGSEQEQEQERNESPENGSEEGRGKSEENQGGTQGGQSNGKGSENSNGNGGNSGKGS